MKCFLKELYLNYYKNYVVIKMIYESCFENLDLKKDVILSLLRS